MPQAGASRGRVAPVTSPGLCLAVPWSAVESWPELVRARARYASNDYGARPEQACDLQRCSTCRSPFILRCHRYRAERAACPVVSAGMFSQLTHVCGGQLLYARGMDVIGPRLAGREDGPESRR